MGGMKRRTKRRPSLLSSFTRIGTKRQGNTISGGNLFPYVYGKSVVEIVEAAVRNQNAEDVEWGPV